MGKIFVLIGPSCSGKDTILKSILENTDLKPLVLYTTRPIRENEINGVTYNFINHREYNEMRDKGQVIEKRVYNTTKGEWLYATCNTNIDLDNYNYITINALEGYQKLNMYYHDNGTVIPLFLAVSKKNRFERAGKREEKQVNPDYEEACRRFLADSKDFSPVKIEAAKIPTDCIFDNNGNINDTIANILEKINIELNRNKNRTR